MHTDYHAELQQYNCLKCDECFYLAAEEGLVCPKCGNRDEDAFVDAVPAEEAPAETSSAHAIFQP
jgi:hypothetical protein